MCSLVHLCPQCGVSGTQPLISLHAPAETESQVLAPGPPHEDPPQLAAATAVAPPSSASIQNLAAVRIMQSYPTNGATLFGIQPPAPMRRRWFRPLVERFPIHDTSLESASKSVRKIV